MAAKSPTYPPHEREKALAIYQEEGPGAASRQTGIPRGTISSWAKRAGVAGPNAERTKAPTEAAKEWARRRVSLRDLSGQAAEEFLAEARAKKQSNARAATDHMRSFSIAVTTANVLAGQTAGERAESQSHEEIDAEVTKLLDETMSAAEQKVRKEILAELNGTGGGITVTPPPFQKGGHTAPSAAQNGAGT